METPSLKDNRQAVLLKFDSISRNPKTNAKSQRNISFALLIQMVPNESASSAQTAENV